jgi:hypothetical protein
MDSWFSRGLEESCAPHFPLTIHYLHNSYGLVERHDSIFFSAGSDIQCNRVSLSEETSATLSIRSHRCLHRRHIASWIIGTRTATFGEDYERVRH